jgi:ketosteroid isomerase-like protein
VTRAVLASALLVCAAASASARDMAAERATLMRLDKEWAAAAAAKDVEKTLSYWGDNARVFPPGQPVVIGKDALRKYVTDGFAIPGFAVQWETAYFVVNDAGDMAYGVGTNSFSMNGPDGAPMAEKGRSVTVWKKGADGTWKCVIDIWNPAPAGPAAAK